MEEECVNLVKNNLEFAFNSGKFLAQMGRFDSCDDMDNSSYFLAYFNRSNKSANVNIGLCLPDVCSNELVENYLNAVVDSYKLVVDYIDVNPQKDTYEKIPLFYVTLTLLALFFVLGLVALVWRKRSLPKESYSVGRKLLNTFDLG